MKPCVVLYLLIPVVLAGNAAILGTGDVNDLGWSFVVNQGVVETQVLLNTTTVNFIPNVNGDSTNSTIQALVESGIYSLIIGTTFVHRPPMIALSYDYPNMFFVCNNVNIKPYNNVGTISTNVFEGYYVLGFYSGLMTKNGKVGIVVPGSNYTISTNTNMFHVGMKKANPNATLYMVWTTQLLQADLALGAATWLVEGIGVDVLSQQQDDFTVPIYAIGKGMLAQGTTGIDLSTVYGQSVGLSIVRDWTPAYSKFAAQNLQGLPGSNYTVKSITGSLATGLAKLSAFSFYVPPSVQQAVQAEVDNIVNLRVNISCGDVWLPVDPASPGNCLSAAQLAGMQQDLPGIVYVGTYVEPTTEVELSNSYVAGFASVASIGIALSVLFAAGVVILRNTTPILMASPVFCLLSLLGSALLFVSVVMRLPSQTDGLCIGSVWMASLGFTALFGHLIAKNYRIWRIFDDPLYKQIVMRNYEVFGYACILTGIDILLLGLWTGVGTVQATQSLGTDDLGPYEYRMICTSDDKADAILYTIVAFHAATLGIGCFLAFKTRKVDIEEFKESPYIAIAVYTAAFATAIGISVLFSLPYYVSRIALICSLFLFCTFTTICVLFVPKFWAIFTDWENANKLPWFLAGSSGTGTKSSSSGSSGL